jgi:hypothetical protein
MVIPNRERVVAVISALALAGGLLTLALLSKPAQAQAEGATSEQFPTEFTINTSACGGEVINVTGTIHTVNRVRVDEDGTFHGTSHFNLVGVKGVGLTSGDNYVIPGSGAVVHNVVQPGQIVTGTVDINLVIGKGQQPNQVALARVHYVISPEGEIKVESISFHFKCQPGNASPTPTASATATKASPTAKASPGTGGAPLAMGASLLLVGAGLAARRFC